MSRPNEREPLLRSTSSQSYQANDSGFGRYAADTAVYTGVVVGDVEQHIDEAISGRIDDRDGRVRGRHLAIILIGLWMSNFTFAVQSSAVPTLAPRISASFSHSELASYLGSIFPLFSTAFTPVYGVLLDAIGRKGAMLVAGFLYGAGTLACGLSPSMGSLIASRAVAGAGGAGLLTVTSVITTDLTSLRERGYYQGLMMVVFGLGASVGGPVSGWIADRFSWPWAFYAQMPFLVLSIGTICAFLPEAQQAIEKPSLWRAMGDFDTTGTFLLLGSISSLLLAFSNRTAFLYEWSDSRVWGLLVSFGLLTVLFLGFEARLAKNPIVPLYLFRGQTLPCVFLSNFTLSVAAQTFLFHIPVYFTSVLDSSSATAGAHLLPNSIGLAVGSILAGQIIKQTGKYTTLSAIGLAMPILAIFSAKNWTEQTSELQYWLAIFPAGLGYSIFLCCGLVALIAAVDPVAMPKATSLLYTFRSLGTTTGIALSSSLQQAIFVNHLNEILPDTAEKRTLINDILHSKSAIYILPQALQARIEHALADSLSWTFIAGAVAALVCLLTSLPIRERNLDDAAPLKPKAGAAGNTDDST